MSEEKPSQPDLAKIEQRILGDADISYTREGWQKIRGDEVSEVVDRVAKALLETGGDDDWETAHEGVSGAFRKEARVAIAAMREPTEEMVEAGRSVTATWLNIEGTGLTIAREKMKRRFRAMIDAALAEGKR